MSNAERSIWKSITIKINKNLERINHVKRKLATTLTDKQLVKYTKAIEMLRDKNKSLQIMEAKFGKSFTENK